VSLKNWDNKTWLSSNKYIKTFNNFLSKQIKLNRDSQILDIGCGRGKILGSLSSKLRLKNKPIGIDIEKHKDRDRRIHFKKINAIDFMKKNKKKFDLIIIKQTIHLLKFKEIKKLIDASKMQLNENGKILILTLETSHNEIPTFLLMKRKLKKSLERDKKIIQYISKLYPKNRNKKFSFKVKISRDKYTEMIKNRYISTLLGFSLHEILKGINQINLKYEKTLSFNDKLICIILDK
tara:strand:- start:511 stop:1218 length:708 start_codon:yes stop_codon:yes gene_type:complete